jgi:hypothetical protein
MFERQLPSRATENLNETADTTQAIESPDTLVALLVDAMSTLDPLHATTAETALAAPSRVKNGQRDHFVAAATD